MTCFFILFQKDVNRPPWIETEVLLLIRKKNRTRRKAKLDDSVNLRERFRKIFFLTDDRLRTWLNLKDVVTSLSLVLP